MQAIGFAMLSVMAALGQTVSAAPDNDTRIEITLEKRADDRAVVMEPRHVFDAGDLVRFRFKADLRGYLYVLNHATSGKDVLLFPGVESGMDNRIEAGHEYLVPATEGGWFTVTEPPGQEVIYWIVSPVEIPAPGKVAAAPPQSPHPSAAGDLPAGMTPRCDDTLFRARGECLDISAGAQAAKPAALPESLANLRGAVARDLVVTNKANTTAISATGALHGPTLFEFRLAHK